MSLKMNASVIQPVNDEANKTRQDAWSDNPSPECTIDEHGEKPAHRRDNASNSSDAQAKKMP